MPRRAARWQGRCCLPTRDGLGRARCRRGTGRHGTTRGDATGRGGVRTDHGSRRSRGRLRAPHDRRPPRGWRASSGRGHVVEETGDGLRCPVVHYLRPTERDAQGHVQRRPPAVLAAWDEALDVYEHYAWAITPELADRVDRAQADLEERQAERASFLDACAAEPIGADEAAARVERYLSSEAPRTPAPEHQRARPAPSPRQLDRTRIRTEARSDHLRPRGRLEACDHLPARVAHP